MEKLKLKWQLAEDSFLRAFSDIEEKPWGRVYRWAEHPEWPKFSFIRFLDSSISDIEVLDAALEFKKNFSRNSDEYYLRIPRSIGLSREKLKKFTKDTDSIVSISYDPLDASYGAPIVNCELKECLTEESLRLWWEVNSDARERKNPFNSSLWPFILKKKILGTRYFILVVDDKAVTSGAIENFSEGYNSWGLGTRIIEQKKGYSKLYMREIAKLFGNLLFSQVDLDEPRFEYLKRLKSFQLLEIEDLYVF